MKEENNQMKNRLSEILKDRFDITMLEEVDNLQGRCIHTDEMISSLRNDVTELNRLDERASEDRSIIKEIKIGTSYLPKKIAKAEKKFATLKIDFNHLLSESIL
jgi:hypothetical protein